MHRHFIRRPFCCLFFDTVFLSFIRQLLWWKIKAVIIKTERENEEEKNEDSNLR